MPLKYTPVPVSSFVNALAYDEPTRTLGVRHNDGTEVHYQNVSKETHEGLKRAKSKGSFLHANVRGKHKHLTIK